jgi:hypothetical protein
LPTATAYPDSPLNCAKESYLKNCIRLSILVCAIFTSAAFAAGAIAIDDEEGSTDAGYGFVTGASSRDVAGAEAMKLCKKAGNSDCRIVARFDTCGAYAASKTHYGTGWGSSMEKAKAMATDKCEGACKIIVAQCE